MPPRPRRAPMRLDDMSAADLARVQRVLTRAYGDLGTLRARYPGADAEIRLDEDAVGAALTAVRDTRARAEDEERERDYLDRVSPLVHVVNDDERSIADGP